MGLTVDHGLRAASAAEAAGVGVLCLRFGLAHETLAWTGPKPATGLQAAAREARYRLMEAAADRLGLVGVATGHTADDQAETVAMRRLRSADAAAAGLAGIPPATLFDGRLWVLRPLLATRRDTIRQWLTRAGQGWIDDPSNADSRFERVRMRRQLSDGVAPADAADIAGARLAQADAVAALIEAAGTRLADGRFRLEPGQAPAAVVLAAAEAMIGLAGGRRRAMDRAGRALLADFILGGTTGACTLGRAVMTRSGGALILQRERRDLPEISVAPLESCDWDGRFRITNRDARTPLLVRAGPTPGLLPVVLRQGDGSGDPAAATGLSGAGFDVEPLCGRASRLLPVFELPVARSLANLAGARPFPDCPWASALN
ncbi:tRNA(Ile)-lysidine synthase [Hoeflea marina]|uniref:tRNA(Ile)-lysidine synthetase n=1 Tax=Hoeflea marina TaxID=274592 RepID=A0A317PDQ9_9HYPH|nr:tRNA(Ile)-lysidine synthase [Hoeflea marina]